MRKIIIIVLVLSVLGGFAFWKFGPNLWEKPIIRTESVVLNIWGLWEEENLLRPALEEYRKKRPDITVSYTHNTSLNYRSRVQTKIANNEGPDIFLVHNTWLPMFLKTNLLSHTPEAVMSASEFGQVFYPVARDSLTKEGKIYAFPRGVDGLALFYNEELLKNVGASIPQTWDQFIDTAYKLTVLDGQGRIRTAGAAMGSSGNIDHWPDILGLLFLQQQAQSPQANITRPGTPEGLEVIKFYTSFITDPRKKSWDVNLEPSTQAFAAGRLAFYFAPSWRAFELRAVNPELKFKTAPVPQLPGKNVGWGSFWAYAVSAKSANQKEAWEFLKFLTSAETQRLLYQEAAKVRLFGLPYSRVEMQKELADDPLVGSFVNQGPIFKSWYLASKTFDNGINDEMIKYFEDAINATLAGQDPTAALQTTDQGVQQILGKYTSPTQP